MTHAALAVSGKAAANLANAPSGFATLMHLLAFVTVTDPLASESVARIGEEVSDLPREERYGPAHPVKLVEGGLLHGLLGHDEIQVNSLHSQGIDRLAADLRPEAIAPDGLVEAMSLKDPTRFVLGVQWHPEWRYRDNPDSRAIFEAFGEAARRRMAAAS